MTKDRFRVVQVGNNDEDGGVRVALRVLQDYRYVGLAGVGLILCAVLALATLFHSDGPRAASAPVKPQVVVVRVPVTPTSTKPGATHTKRSGHPGPTPAPTTTEIIRTSHTVTVKPKKPTTPKPTKSTHSPKAKPKPKPTPSPTKSKSCVDALGVASICLGGNQ